MPRVKAAIATVILSIIVMFGGLGTFAQQPAGKSQEISDIDGEPVLLKHLPEQENVQAGAVFGTDKASLDRALGDRPVLRLIEFPVGTEYVTAAYPQGRLLIVEYTNPQASVEADGKILEYIEAKQNDTGLVYRRVGNYNAFVFDASDAEAANELIGQVKYQKTVQWLGEDPHILKRLERYMISTSRDVAISTVKVIAYGIGGSLLTGILAGFIFFRMRDQKRAHRAAFSDAGGLTRLNLDGLSE